MSKKLIGFFTLIVMNVSTVVGQDTLLVEWSGEPGLLEQTITADTLSDGTQAHDVYLLEAGKVYLMLTELNVNDHMEIRSTEPTEAGGMPAVLQPFAREDGTSGFTQWPGGFFEVYGTDTRLILQDLVFMGTALGLEFAVSGVVTQRGHNNHVHMNNTVTSGTTLWVHSTFGTSSDFILTNSIAKGFTSYAGGQFFGGITWGAGSWMGTMDTLIVQYNTLTDINGNPIVVQQQVDHGLIDHNTIANTVVNVNFWRGMNNTTVSNNLYINTNAYGQSNYDVTGWGIIPPGGLGQFPVAPDHTHPDSVTYAGSGDFKDEVDHMDRNIHYHNNVVHFTEDLVDMMSTPGTWSWDVVTTTYDTLSDGTVDTVVTTTQQEDSFLDLAVQKQLIDDSTQYTIDMDRGLMIDATNIMADPGVRVSPEYIKRQIDRTMDFRDNLVHDKAEYKTQFWQWEVDGNLNAVYWPVVNTYYDYSYDKASYAATASATGGMVGDPRWFERSLLSVDEPNITPRNYTLEQNYPNPFNPTTTISFSLKVAGPVKLTIFDVLGQEVATLVDEYKPIGSHKVQWRANDMPSGVYYYKLEADGFSKAHKMVLIK